MFNWFNMLGGAFGAPRVRVAVAVTGRPGPWRYLVAFNEKWRAYSFPMKKVRVAPTGDPLRDRRISIDTARDAFLEDMGEPFGLTREGRWMDRIEVEGTSGRTGQPGVYEYDIVQVEPANDIPEGAFGTRHGFLTADEIRQSDPAERGPLARMITWTTWQVLTRLLDNQQVAVAIVRRGDLYLMTRGRYGHWFFPARRMGDGRAAWETVVGDFREWNINLRMEPAGEEVVDLEQPTRHLGPREYRFHLQGVDVPVEALASELEGLGRRRNLWYAWKSLDDAGEDMSPTLDGLREAARRLPRIEGGPK